jgi:HAD superfamily phosphatase (TIGR01668 family)
MIALEPEGKTPLYVPNYLSNSVTDIDFERLAREGIKYVAFDADSTLVPYRGVKIAPSTLKHLMKQRKLFKKWCIASNRITNDLEPLARSIDAGVIRADILIRKPDIRFFRTVLEYFGASPDEVVMVGDKLIADIYGGNRAGLKTVWVEKLGRDSLIDRLIHLRKIEKRLLKRYIT